MVTKLMKTLKMIHIKKKKKPYKKAKNMCVFIYTGV